MPNTNLTTQEKQAAINSFSDNLLKTYVFPDVAKQMAALIIENNKKGNYDSIHNPHDFANQLTEDLLSISKDKHIRIKYNPQEIAEKQANKEKDKLDYQNNYVNRLKRENFGFKELKILSGNIGYLDLRSFSEVKYAGETAVAAMNFLSNSDAVIIDLRMNGGGSPQMIQLISTYLFSDGDPVHLHNFYWRPTDTHTQTWTLPHVQGNRFPDTAVYILTSKRTFSAAEEFSFNLKNLKRATLIGETTGGGAHPGGPVHINDKYTIFIPFGAGTSPITNTNWEGTGVTPHIEAPENQALEIAHVKALETLLENCKVAEQKAFYEWCLTGLNALLEPQTIETAILKSYTGNYGPRKISFENNKLYSQLHDHNKNELIPLAINEFRFKNNDSAKIKFIVENGETVSEVHFQYGHSFRRELKNKA